MKNFASAIVACDHTPETLKTAIAIRGVLEGFGIRVHFYHLIQKRQVLELLNQRNVDCEYIVLCTHGGGRTPEDMNIRFQVVDQTEGENDKTQGWEQIAFDLTPANISEYVQHAHGTLISTACGGGREPFAQAFLAAGYRAYIGSVEEYYDGDAGILFVAGFFYHLLAQDRDYAPRSYSEREAVERAAGFDADFEAGTCVFHYYD